MSSGLEILIRVFGEHPLEGKISISFALQWRYEFPLAGVAQRPVQTTACSRTATAGLCGCRSETSSCTREPKSRTTCCPSALDERLCSSSGSFSRSKSSGVPFGWKMQCHLEFTIEAIYSQRPVLLSPES